ncbi:MAG: isoprenylcysteine carboxylmethyltransferase family protein [Pseudomonadota bacterium]
MSDGPSKFPWPPVLVVGLAAMGWFGSPASGASGLQLWIGIVLIFFGVALDGWSAAHLVRRKTAVLPRHAASHLVTDGPFRFSRNPIYLGYVIVLVGLAVFRPGAASLFAVPIFIALMLRLAIEPEEQHLSARFGVDWSTYAKDTPRWLGPL